MPKSPAPHYNKISLNVTDPQYEHLQDMADRRQIPLTVLMRRSFATLAILDQVQQRADPGYFDWVVPAEEGGSELRIPLILPDDVAI